MRPLLLNFSAGWGGLEMFSADLFARLRAAGVEARFLTRPGTKLEERLRERGLGEHLVLRPARKYVDLGVRRAIRAELREQGVDLVHTFQSSDVFHAALGVTGHAPRAALVHHLQMLPGHARRDPAHVLAYRRLDRVLTITRQIEERVRALWPVPPERVRTLYYGIDEDRPRRSGGGGGRARERFGLPAGRRLLGLVGQICEIKGQLFVLEAFGALAREHPDVDLVFAGSPPARDDASYPRRLAERIRELGLERRVHSLGFCSDVPGLMPALDWFVLGSREEAFGLVLIEAMAAGVVPIASRAGGVPEIVDDGVDGLLYASRDAADLERALRTALALDPADEERMRARAIAKVAERFSARRMLAEVLEVYAEVTAGEGVLR